MLHIKIPPQFSGDEHARALGFDDNSVVAMNLALKNTSLSEFRVTENSWQLQSFNAMPHYVQLVDVGFHTRV